MGNHRKMYIGQSYDLAERFKQHNVKKFFWSTAIAFIRKDDGFDRAQIQYLEYKLINEAFVCKKEALLENYQIPKEPYMSQENIKFITDVFTEAKILLSYAGFKMFDNEIRNHLNTFKDNHKSIIHRIAKEYYDNNNTNSEPVDEDNDDIVTYVLHDSDCYVEATPLNECGKFMIIPYGYVKTTVNVEDLPEEYRDKIDNNTKKIIKGFVVSDLEEASMIATGSRDVKWTKKIVDL